MVVEQNKTYVAKLRVRSAARETLSLQLRLNQALTALNLHPAGMPSSAIAFIRKLHDPAPGSLNLQDTAGVPLAWGRAVADSLDQIVRRAARPALGQVGASVDAVLFVDRAELLACLAADWCDGTAITRWWWRSMFRATDVSSAVVREWLTSIEYVPAAFAKLAEKETAITFARDLPARVASRLLEDITRHFGLTELRDALASRTETQARESSSSAHGEAARSIPPEMLSSREALQLRTRVATEAFAPRLEQHARVLLAVALMLERAPTLLRERGFASRLFSSLALKTPELAAEQSQRNAGQVADLTEARAGSLLRPLIASPGAGGEIRAIESPATAEKQRSQHDNSYTPPEEPGEPEQDGVLARDGLTGRDRENAESIAPPVESSSVTVGHRAPVVLEATSIPETKVTAATFELAIETKLGGVFYLINAALALNLYGDFTRPLEPGIELSIWDFLVLIGRELIGKRIEFDPIWPLLAKLAGREESEQPGARFKPPDEQRMPPDWLNAFPERDEWSYRTNRGRLIVWRPEGFDVMDLKLGSRFRMKDIEARLASETRNYSNVAGFKRRRFVPGGVRRRQRERGLDRWTRWIADYLRVRLARSLGIRPADGLTPMLFARDARVEVTPALLDVFFSLAELPVEIRLAGLDRDPGWLPAGGRAIAFHYD